jgi:iron complex transport system substrate-binding protein
MRIVSLLPSATEILFELGLGEQVVGVTFECDFPPEARSRQIVSTSALPERLSPAEIDAVVKQRIAAGEDLYHLDRGAFADLDPDIVVTQDLCAVCAVDVSEVDDALAYLACNADVLTLDPMSLDQVLASIVTVGQATGTAARAETLVDNLRGRLDTVRSRVSGAARRKVLLLEWTEPAFTAGHWVPDMIEAAGGTCVLGFPRANSRGVEWDRIADSGAEIVIVSPCGYRLDGATTLAAEVVARGVLPPSAEVWAVDADAIVVRPGPRVVDGVEVFASIIHRDRAGTPDAALARPIR